MPNDTGTSRVACGLIRSKTVREATHEYFSQAVMFPVGYDARTVNDPYRAVGVSQNFQYYGYPAGSTVSVQADHLYNSPHPAITMILQSGECQQRNLWCPIYSGLITGAGYSPRGLPPDVDAPFVVIPPGSITRGVWYQYLVHVHWSTNNDGLVEAWYRPRGGSWIRSVSPQTGFPTLSWGWNANQGVWISKESVNGRRSSAKFGYYNPNPLTPQTLYWDHVCEATTFEAAASC
jgi:hypothetical protein